MRTRVHGAYEYCRALVEDIGPRPAGTTAERRAAHYIESRLEEAGLAEVRQESFPCLSWDVIRCTMSAADPEVGNVEAWPGAYSGSTPAQGVDAELLYFDSAAEIKWSDRRLRGKALIVYGEAGVETGVGMRAKAKMAGVACLVSVSNRPWPIVSFEGWPDDDNLPHLSIGYWDATRIRKAGCRRAKIDCRVKIRRARSQNVVALVRGARPSAEQLCLGAHYDSVPGTPGAGDNAAGVAVVMAAAEALQRHPPAADVRVVLFGGEEIGLAGARAYARAHRDWWNRTRLLVYFDGMGDVVGRNMLHVVGYRDLSQWAEEVAREAGYPCEVVDEPVLLDNAWLDLHGVPCVRPARPPQLAWHSRRDDMSVMSQETMLDAAAYAVELLHRASAGETLPFTPGVPDAQIKRIKDCWGGPTWWGRWEKQMPRFMGGEKRR